LFDFGYSLFAFVLFARYLGDWLITDLGHPDYVYTTAQAATALSLLVLMPLAGVLADVIGRHVPLLAAFTLVAAGGGVALTFMSPDLGALGVVPILVVGSVSAAATALASPSSTRSFPGWRRARAGTRSRASRWRAATWASCSGSACSRTSSWARVTSRRPSRRPA
jgi:MFS family permease